MEVRNADARDLPAINQIYNHYVDTSHCTFDIEPMSAEDREKWFEQFSHGGPHQLLVAERDGDVLGYTYSSTLRPRQAYDVSVESTVYIRQDSTGSAVGNVLYSSLFAAIAARSIHRVYAGIALPNEASVRLHERFGFTRIGLWSEVGRKFDRFWDVAWYEKKNLDC